jgi:hypothetical protein
MKIIFSGCRETNYGKSTSYMLNKMPFLRTLHIVNDFSITDHNVKCIFRSNLMKIEDFNLTLEKINQLSSSIFNGHFELGCCEHVSGCTLTLKNLEVFNDKSNGNMPLCRPIKKLTIDSCPLTEESIEQLLSNIQTKVRHIELINCTHKYHSNLNLFVCKLIQTLKVSTISLYSCPLTKEFIDRAISTKDEGKYNVEIIWDEAPLSMLPEHYSASKFTTLYSLKLVGLKVIKKKLR